MRPLPRRVWRRAEGCLNALPNKWLEPTEPPRRLCGSTMACVPCMLSCLGVKVPRPGIRGAEGQGKRKGVTARWGLKEAWNERAGRGTRTR
jgi:hypothetical protein